MKNFKSIILIILWTNIAFCQINYKDSIQNNVKNDSIKKTSYFDKAGIKLSGLIPATAFLGYGIWTLNNKTLREFNVHLKDELEHELGYKDKYVILDGYSQYLPETSVYLLNLVGIEGKHRFVDRTIIFATAYTFLYFSVEYTKKFMPIRRPKGSSKEAFPSGHTATAFMGAEFLYQEYKDVSVWYGVAGYVAASGTAFLRMYNKYHWFNDVVAGAGYGILCTKAAYLVHPLIRKVFPSKKNNSQGMIMPFYDGETLGIGLRTSF